MIYRFIANSPTNSSGPDGIAFSPLSLILQWIKSGQGGGPTSETPEPVETIPDNPLIYSATKDQVNKLGKKNPNLWHLIDAFDLIDENGMEIRNQKTA